jgi:peptidoglycan/xylan/chitin deacetylase (PgdA/CDA1 family)
MNFRLFICGLTAFLIVGCSGTPEKKDSVAPTAIKDSIAKPTADTVKSFKGIKVPVLCYHAIREIEKGDGPDQKAYSVSPENFALQMKALADNGYTTITPDQLKDFHTSKKPLPEKPIIITFDDGRKEQFTIGATEMEKYNFKGVFFIMTVSLGRSHYMSRADVKALADKGHIIGSHTWDHHKVTGYKGDDWTLQIAKPKKQLEEMTGKPVTSFAYPNGAWNAAAADSLKSNGFTTAFLFGTKQDATRPLYTFERLNGPNIGNMGKFIGRVEKSAE